MIRKKQLMLTLVCLMLISLLVGGCSSNTETKQQDAAPESSENAVVEEKQTEPIKIGIVTSKTGPLEAYGQQMLRGFELGIEYATEGTKTVAGRPIVIIEEDSQTKPEIGIQKALDLLERDNVDILIGSASSAVALAILPLAEEYERVMLVEPAVADSITGSQWNRYIFRTGRNSSQDAVAAATAIAKPGVKIVTLAQDYAYGHESVAAFKNTAINLGAEIIMEEYAPQNATDLTANIQRIVNQEPDYLYVVWAGANTPWKQLVDMKVTSYGIKLSGPVADIPTLKTMNDVIGLEGFAIYYHKLPNNEVNNWLVAEHQKKYNEPPDLFTAGGMAAAMAIVEALNQSGGDAGADKLITIMEGMSFETPKGTMTFRQEDHQALQALYAIELKDTGLEYPEPVLIREMTPEETEPPIKNGR